MIKAVIFDMDGLMFDSESISYRIWMELLNEKGLAQNSEFVYSIRGRNSYDASFIYNEFYPNSPINYFDLRAIKNKRIRTELLNNPIPFKKGLLNILNYLKENKIKMAVASSTQTEYVIKYLEKENIKSYFEYIIGGDMVTHSKPDPMIFNMAQKALGVKKEECVVLEDSRAGIFAALNGGFRSIWIPDELYYPDVREKTTYYASDLDEAINIIDEENNIMVLVKSFDAKIILSDEFIKKAYLRIKRSIDCHNLNENNLFNSISFIHNGNKLISIKMKKNRLYVYFALENVNYDNKYIFNEQKYKVYETTPTLVKVYDEEGLHICLTLLEQLYKEYGILEGFDFFDEKAMFLKYLSRPVDVIINEGLAYWQKEKRSKYNNGLQENTANVTFNCYVNNDIEVNNLYICGNIPQLGGWDDKKAVKIDKVDEHKFTLSIRLPKGYFEFKVLNERNWVGVEKGIWKEEISNHTYTVVEDMVIEDVIYNFNNR